MFEYISVFSDSYKWLMWQHYLTAINFKYIFGDSIEIPTHIYQSDAQITEFVCPCYSTISGKALHSSPFVVKYNENNESKRAKVNKEKKWKKGNMMSTTWKCCILLWAWISFWLRI